jgi:hypothetical protein
MRETEVEMDACEHVKSRTLLDVTIRVWFDKPATRSLIFSAARMDKE